MSSSTGDPAQPTGHTPRRILSPRRRITPPASTYPAEPWRLVEKRFSPRYLAQAESLFATSNGYLGIRGTFEEGTPVVQEGTFLNGFYETWPIVYGEEAFGFAKTGQTMLNVTDGSLIKLYVDDEPFDLAGVEIEAYERALDMRTGTLDRTVEWETHDGRHLRVVSRRLVSLEHRHLAAILYEVTVLDASASLTIASQLRTRHERPSAEGDPRRAREFEGQVLHRLRSWAGDRRVLLSLETASSGLVMACGMDHTIETDCRWSEEAVCNDESGRVVFLADVEPGRTVRLIKYLSYHHGRRDEEEELGFRAARTLDRARNDGFEKILESQERRVSEWWERADVEIEGAPEVQHAVRFNLFQILQASARVEGFGIPAKGLTGQGYEGHYFWDTEMYVLPLLTYAAPQVAKTVLRHRCSMLDQARRRAAEVNQKGALFPWRTINGEEASAYYAAGTAQYHINADIAWAIRKYVATTGDLDLLLAGGAEVLFETARLWADLGFYSPAKDGKFCINGVTGPDEYTAVVDNNAFTNLMARENLRAAIATHDMLKGRWPEELDHVAHKIELAPEEVSAWGRAAESMYVPFDERAGIHLQDDGFIDREVWDFENTPPEKYPLLLHYHPLVIYRHQVIKQADVVLATFLLGQEFSLEEKKRIFDYYDPLTTGDSSLSVCIQSIMAAEIGYRQEACDYFNDAVAMDLGDIGGNVKDGCHIASMGGTWMALIHGFAGLRDPEGKLSFRPYLPAGWTRMRFRLCKREQRLEVEVTPEETTYRLLQGGRLDLLHCGEELCVEREAPVVAVNS